MKLFRSNLSTLLLIFALYTFSSCEKESINDEAELSIESNLETKKGSSLVEEYWCSEELGTYESELYVNHGVYFSPFYIPDPTPAPGQSKWATWMSDIQSWLRHDFNDVNASGSNSSDVDIIFEIIGDGGTGYLNATDGNRLYNEFVCRMMNQLSVSSADDLDIYEFNLDITVDYYLCGCAKVVAYGTAYY